MQKFKVSHADIFDYKIKDNAFLLKSIISMLTNGKNGREIYQEEIVKLLGIKQNTVSYHLNNLVKQGLIIREKSGKSYIYKVEQPEKYELISPQVLLMLKDDPILYRQFVKLQHVIFKLRQEKNKKTISEFIYLLDFYMVEQLEELLQKLQEKGVIKNYEFNLKITLFDDSDLSLYNDNELSNNEEIKTEETKVEIELKPVEEPKKEPEIKELSEVIENYDQLADYVNYFYDLIGKKPRKDVFENAIIALQDVTKNMTENQVKGVMRYMAERSKDTSLRFFKNRIKEVEYFLLTKKEGTPEYLVNLYYEKIGLVLTYDFLVKDVVPVKKQLEYYDYEVVKKAVETLAEEKNPIFWVERRVQDVIRKQNKKVENEQKMNEFKNNPSFFDQPEANIIHDELIGLRMKADTDDKIEIAKQILLNNEVKKYGKYNSFLWALAVGLKPEHFTKEMYEIVKADTTPIDEKYKEKVGKFIQKIEELINNG